MVGEVVVECFVGCGIEGWEFFGVVVVVVWVGELGDCVVVDEV